MEPNSMVSIISYNVLMHTTFDFPIEKMYGKLDDEFEYKWDLDISASDNNGIKIGLKPDRGRVPSNVGIKKLRQLEEKLKNKENKKALVSSINRSFSDLAVVIINIEQTDFNESTITLNMNFSVENIGKELDSVKKAILDEVLEVFPSLNILDVYLKYFIESLKEDFGKETKTKKGNAVLSSIALPLKKTMTPAEIIKLQKYADIINEPNRYARIEEKLSKEIQKDNVVKPIIFLTEVTRKWAEKLRIFFKNKSYNACFVPGINPGQDYMGQIIAYPQDEYELLNHTMVFKDEDLIQQYEADGIQHYPFQGFQSPSIDWISSNLLEGQNLVGGLTVKETKKIFDKVLTDNKPILYVRMRKKSLVPSTKYNSFIVGSYHMPMRVGYKIWTVDSSTEGDIEKDVGRHIMGMHIFVARAKFETFINKMVFAEIKEGLNGESLRNRIVFVGDMNSVPPKSGFKYSNSTPREQWDQIEHRLKYFLDGSKAGEDNRLADENELNKMIFLYNRKLLENFDFFPTETFPPLDHVYKKMYGEYAERTTRTEEFEGSLDHIFASPKAVIKQVDKMPTTEELLKNKRFFPSPPVNQHQDLEDEPSDHLLQRATFDFGIAFS